MATKPKKIEPVETRDPDTGEIVIDVASSPKEVPVNANTDAEQLETPRARPTDQRLSPQHDHDGESSERISYQNLRQKRLYHAFLVPGTSAATATNYGVVFQAMEPCFVRRVWEVHQTAGTDGSAVTLNLEKLTGTQAPDAGSTMLTAGFDLKGTANTKQVGTLVPLRTTRSLNPGDRLCLKDAGTLTAVAHVLVMVEVELL